MDAQKFKPIEMVLKEIRILFQKDLSAVYPKDEITSIFKLLAQFYLSFDAAELVLYANKNLTKHEANNFLRALERLKNKEPIQHIIGETSFFDLTFKVNSNVLIPRPETEELVQWILTDLSKNTSNQKIQLVDIGTGSGCIAISLAKNIPNASVYALDISKPALSIAKENAIINDVNIHFLNADILKTKELPKTFDLIVSNPPYVKHLEKELMHDNVLEHEPDKALYVPDDMPLVFYKKITELARKHLATNGKLYFEINQYLGNETRQLIQSKGFKNVILKKDFLGNDRMIRAESS